MSLEKALHAVNLILHWECSQDSPNRSYLERDCNIIKDYLEKLQDREMASKGSRKYRCVFEILKSSKLHHAEAESLDRLKDGFWVDYKFEYTTGFDCAYWIPPSRILYIEKI